MPEASLVITTKNRKDELRVALASAFAQTVPLDVIVIDDGSTDGTSGMVSAEFPLARVFTMKASGGLIRRRNNGAALARSGVIFSIDDDAEFSTSRVVEQTLADFDHPRIGAVAIPFCDVKKGDKIQQRATEPTAVQSAGLFIGTAHAVRRDVFLALNGYRAWLIHQGEERDYIIRMLAAGYIVRQGRADIIKHYESPKRDTTRMTLFGRRNDLLHGLCNVPFPAVLLYTPAMIINSCRHAARNGYLTTNLKGIAKGLAAVPGFIHERNPVSAKVFWLFRRLVANPGLLLSAIEAELPPMRPIPPSAPPLESIDDSSAA